MPSLSVLIPTHHRPQVLSTCLEYLAKQTIADELEIIIIHDGQDDNDTKKVIERWMSGLPIAYHAIPKSQQGVARNKALTYVTTDICLIIGDDTFLEPSACEKHLMFHNSCSTPTALLGHVTWDPALEINDVMRFLESSGWQFAYEKMEDYDGQTIPFERQPYWTYTIHLSLPTAVFKKHQFHEQATMYGWEDTEWGSRLRNDGISMVYRSDITGLHHHYHDLKSSLRRMRTVGRCAPYWQQLVPNLRIVPSGLRLLKFRLKSLLPTLDGKHRKAFLEGLKSAS